MQIPIAIGTYIYTCPLCFDSVVLHKLYIGHSIILGVTMTCSSEHIKTL